MACIAMCIRTMSGAAARPNLSIVTYTKAEFGLLLEYLTVRPEALESMARLALEIDQANIKARENIDLEAKRQQELALCQRRLKANSLRFGAGEIDEQEW